MVHEFPGGAHGGIHLAARGDAGARGIHLSGIHLSSAVGFSFDPSGIGGFIACIEMLGSVVKERFEYIILGVGEYPPELVSILLDFWLLVEYQHGR